MVQESLHEVSSLIIYRKENGFVVEQDEEERAAVAPLLPAKNAATTLPGLDNAQPVTGRPC